MTALASSDDVEALLRRPLSTEEAVAVDLLLDQATSVIQAEARQTLVAVTDDMANLAGTWGWSLDLPERPVVDVTHIAIDGVTLSPAAWRWLGGWTVIGGRTPLGGGYPLIVNGPDLGDGSVPQLGSWGGPDRRITVTYSHGYGGDGFPPVPGELSTMCCQIALRGLQAPSSMVRSMTVGDASIAYADRPNGMLELTDWERSILHKYRP